MSLVKGSITPIDPEGDPVFFEYNPSELEVSKEVNWAEIGVPGLDYPLQQFIRGQLKTLSLEIYLNQDHYERSYDVRDAVERFESLVESTEKTGAPPICFFHWGRFDFICVIGSISTRYTMFNMAGEAIEATVRLTLRRYVEKNVSFRPPRHEVALPLPRKAQKPAFEGWQKGSGSVFSPPEEKTITSADELIEIGEVRIHIAKEGETFQSIAALHYGDPALWRAIEYANRNRITDNVRVIRAGERIVVPDIENATTVTEALTNFPPETKEALRSGNAGNSQAETLFRAVK
ncbi:MAG: hypothetical protein E3J72_11970 [Planctomycetota bacterium]|nr:MAG: hypothetical protein E3J72_11970 [Planctomycetota bacterium]